MLAQGGSPTGVTRYLPYGAIRLETGVWSTDRRFTGQRWEGALGLYDYRARFYDPALGRFLQPDSLVPEPGNPQALNRYAYVNNNPLKYTDPSGHWLETAWDILNIGWDIYEVYRNPRDVWNWVALAADVGAAILPAVPGGVGLVVRGGRAAKAGIELATHVDEAADVGRIVAEAASHADEAADALRAIKRAEDTPTVLMSIQSAEDVVNISPEAQRYLQALKEQGQVIVPRGEMSARIMGEISAAAGAEVGLFRLHSGERVMVLGEAHSVAIPPGTRRIIAHTHPSGILQFSKADIAALVARGQRSSVLIDLLGRGRRIHIPE